ncbi:MAG: DUF4124 domain-containing protein [Burkholderiales bacterium]|nr:DUF4124 domain-containing protein [Burkholderiales bacterium]
MIPRPAALALALMTGWLSLSDPTTAQESTIYKWRDANGVVHYSNSPPPKGTDATVLDQRNSKVSVVPAIQAPADAAAGAGAGADTQLQNRVQRLERELEDERRSQAAAAQAQSDAYQRWREECLKQRRLDCDDPAAVPTEVYGYPAPPVVRPPIARPPKPPPSTAPPGYIVGPGPAGIGGQYVPAPPKPQQPAGEPERPRPR